MLNLKPEIIKKFKGVKVVVTGGAGFIGSHLVERLLEYGAEVVVIDTMVAGNKIEHLQGNPMLSIMMADVKETSDIADAFRDADIVFHLAALVGVEETQLAPLDVLNVDIQGTVNVLGLAQQNNIKRVVFASSSEVYGDSSEPMVEEGILCPKSTYAVTKLIGEEYCKAFYKQFGLVYTILRYFNVYGPRQDERFVVSRFLGNMVNNKSMMIYGNGNQTRDFTYVDDVVNMTLISAVSDDARCQAFNIGTGCSITLNNLVDVIQRLIPVSNPVKPKYVEYNGLRPAEIEVFKREADVSKARKLLGYNSILSIESGMKEYLNWYMGRTRVPLKIHS